MGARDYSGLDNVELEVARYALRTFVPRYSGLDYGKMLMGSIAANRPCWNHGVCEAVCLAEEMDWTRAILDGPPRPRVLLHEAPAPSCTCGVYGCLSLGDLVSQYPDHSRGLVTVIAAEGRTMIGDIGLRTARARVVAYWSETDNIRQLAHKEFPDAAYYPRIAEMLDQYRLPLEGIKNKTLQYPPRFGFTHATPSWWGKLVEPWPEPDIYDMGLSRSYWGNYHAYTISGTVGGGGGGGFVPRFIPIGSVARSGVVSSIDEEWEEDNRIPQQKVLTPQQKVLEDKKNKTYPTSKKISWLWGRGRE